ncbi:MAG: cbb3-type cytochrome c oxidase subunit I [Chloroflexales bacterium]|nr:cbb3-type cytochrome c oxidase subunit I [Chloroflexales bacterium]
MPRLSQLMIRTALIWLVVGYTIGGLVLANKGWPILPWIWRLRLAHVHILLVGWTVQLACGVAFWILPRLDAKGSRGNVGLVWFCYATLNSGVLLASLYEPLRVILPSLTAVFIVLAGICYIAAIVAFVAHAWVRIVPFRILPRNGAHDAVDDSEP